MAKIAIEEFGRGRFTAKNASKIPLGAARDSLNFLHNHGLDTATLRNAVDRVWATAAATSPVLAVHELVKSNGTAVLLAKINSTLYTFSLTPSTALGSILTGMNAGTLPRIVTANGNAFIADQAANYVSDGTSAGTNELQITAPSNTTITLASAGTASGNPAGTVYYAYTRVDAYSGAECPPCAAKSVSRTVDQGVTVTNASLSFTTPWTTINLYRTNASGTQFHRVTTGLTAASFPYADTSLDSDLTTVSEFHGDNVLTASIEKPEAARHCEFHRGRLFLANLTGATSRIRWSKILEPTQFNTSTSSRFDVGKFDGDTITGLVSFKGSLVIFKQRSIWIMNGDVDETGFTFFPAVTGIGCIAPRTIVKDGDSAIYFLSEQGVYSFDLAGTPEQSGNIASDFTTLKNSTRLEYFTAGFEPRTKLYKISVTPSAGSLNTTTHVFNVETGAWGREQLAMGQVVPSCYSNTADNGPIHNGSNVVKLYVGDANGWFYEMDAATGADGVTSGTKSGTVTSSSPTTTTCSAAAFRTTGQGLKNLSMTLRRAADSSYETVAITSNTATIITHGAWSGTAPVAGDTVYVGGYEGLLYLNRVDFRTVQRKRFERVEVEYEKQTHAVPLRISYVLDDGAVPTTGLTEFAMNNGYIGRLPIHRRGAGLSLYFNIIGVDHPTDFILMTLEAEVFAARRPMR